jgi:hypothetical protein
MLYFQQFRAAAQFSDWTRPSALVAGKHALYLTSPNMGELSAQARSLTF